MLEVNFDPIVWTQVIVAIAVIFQTIELLTLRPIFDDRGIWRWETLKRDFSFLSRPFQAFLKLTLSYRNFVILLWLRLFASFLLIYTSNFYLVFFLFVSTLLISIRWRGAFNGGSDYMTIIVLLSLSISALYPQYPKITLGCLYYIAIQSCFSYFIAGISKLKSVNWRRGAALHAFIESGTFEPSTRLLSWLCRPIIAVPLSWSIIIFECAFPVALFNRYACVVLICAAFLFHLGNVFLLGLNRFLFIWAATYPALFWCSRI